MNEDTCTTCGKVAGLPYRQRDHQSETVFGCVDAFHSKAILSPSSAAWHNRRDAKAIRLANKKRLAS